MLCLLQNSILVQLIFDLNITQFLSKYINEELTYQQYI